MNVGTLTIEIAANVARLKADMDETKKAVSGAMKDVTQYVGYARTAFIGLTGIAGVSAFTGMISGAIEGKARLYDLSLQTGISVEALSSLSKVAKYSDTSITDVAAASNKLSKALYTTNEDSKGAAQALKALGINFDQFKGMQPDEQMRAVAMAMAGFNDGTGKAATAMLLFGKQGAQLLPFLTELAERNQLVGKETTASAKAAKEYEDNIITLRAAGDEWKKQLVNDILPSLVNITNELIDGKKAYGSWINAILDQGLNVDPFKTQGENMTNTREQLERYRTELARVNKVQEEGGMWARITASRDADRKKFLEGEIALLQQRDTYTKTQQARQALALGDGVTDRFTPRKGNLDPKNPEKEKKEKLSEYDKLIAKLREKAEAERQEEALQRNLTAAEKDALDVMVELRDGKLKLTDAQARNVTGLLEERLANEALNKQREREKKWIEEANRENERAFDLQTQRTKQLQDEAAAMADQLATYGLTHDQLEALQASRLRDAAAALEQKAVWAESSGFLDDQVRFYRDQAKALRDTAELRERIAQKESTERNDPYAGLNRAVNDYLERVKRAGDDTYQAVGNAMQGLEDLTTNFLSGGKADIKAWVNSVISEIIRLRVVKPLLADIFGGSSGGGLGGLINSLFGGGSSGLMSGASGFGDANAVAAIAGGRASGGGVTPGQLVPVNEQGTELLSMGGRDFLMVGNQSGQVRNASQTSASMGKSVNVSYAPVIHIDSRTDQAEVARQTNEAVQQGNKQMVALLRSRGVL